MRTLLLIALVTFCCTEGIAQHKQTKEETVKWLQSKFTQARPGANQKGDLRNSTKICVSCSAKDIGDEIKEKDFTAKIASYIYWKQDQIEVQNDIFENGKLKEAYTYRIPLTAITRAWLTNCQRNTTGEVNAYKERPLFIGVKKNATTVSHVTFDKTGKVISGKADQFSPNNKEGDWGMAIPVVMNWSRGADLQDKVLNAFRRLAEFNGNKVASK